MGEVLSQEEVDALLSGLTGGDIKSQTDQPVSGDQFTSYDLTNQDRIVRGRLPTLEIVHERFTRLFSRSIHSTMQQIIDVNVLNVDSNKYGEFIRSSSIPSSYHIFRMDPLTGHGLLVLEGKLIFTLVNRLFGGKGPSYYKMEGRDFTAIEQKLIKSIVDLILKDYNAAWQPVHPINIVHARAELNPQFVSIVTHSESVVVIEIELSFEEVSERLFFCLPYSTIDPIKEKLKKAFQGESMENLNQWSDRVISNLREVPVEVCVKLGSTEKSGREILDLHVGDIIELDERSDSPLDIFVEETLKMRGTPGSSRGNQAIRVSEILRRKRT